MTLRETEKASRSSGAGLTARMEPFDSFWEAPENVEKGYSSFNQYYKCNYAKHLPRNRTANILVISCGPGYFVNLLREHGYTKVLGIDSSPEKVKHAQQRDLNCIVAEAFPFIENKTEEYDLIFCEQELNHLTKEETLLFLALCKKSLRASGKLMVHGLNGANPLTGAEALAQNFDHYNTFTEYSLRQVLKYSGFHHIKVIPLKLYVFYKNPVNYALIALDMLFTAFFRFSFLLYGKTNKLFTKKIAAICQKDIDPKPF